MSPIGEFGMGDLVKVIKGAVIASVSAALAYLSVSYVPILAQRGTTTALITAVVISVLANIFRKLCTDTRPTAADVQTAMLNQRPSS